MSFSEFLSDVFTGNETHAWSRLKDWWSNSAEPELKDFLTKAESAEGKILSNLVGLALKDVAAGGFTTASFVAAGKDVLAQLIAQNISTFSMQNVMAMLNIKAAPLVAAASPDQVPAEPTPTPSDPAPAPSEPASA